MNLERKSGILLNLHFNFVFFFHATVSFVIVFIFFWGFFKEWKNKTALQRLCMLRALRPDRMTYAVA